LIQISRCFNYWFSFHFLWVEEVYTGEEELEMMEESVVEGAGPNFGQSRIRLVEEPASAPHSGDSSPVNSATLTIPLNSPTDDSTDAARNEGYVSTPFPTTRPRPAAAIFSPRSLLDYFAFRVRHVSKNLKLMRKRAIGLFEYSFRNSFLFV
jgi:hypothetical protein